MSKFNKLYEEIIKKDHPIFKPASKEELKRRKDTKFQRWLDEEIESGNITKNSDGTYDAKDDIDISRMDLTKIPIQFNKVNGHFRCSGNYLTSLGGAPKEVDGFDCSRNKLTSLEGAPKEVNGFSCSFNYLTSLKGCPEKVNRLFACSSNYLTSLEGAPKEVNGEFICSRNDLTSLKGAPKEVNGFSCNYNNLTSLEGTPEKINGDFACYHQKNGHKFTKEEVKAVCNVKGYIYV